MRLGLIGIKLKGLIGGALGRRVVSGLIEGGCKGRQKRGIVGMLGSCLLGCSQVLLDLFLLLGGICFREGFAQLLEEILG